jgi:thiol-disulfide isomerase/thioredoxin
VQAPAGSAAARGAGVALAVALALLGAANLTLLVRHFDELKKVSTPRGSAAPELTLPLISGGKLDLAAERGRPVVLAFWASWCPPCIAELPSVDRAARRFAERVHFFAVNTEGDRAAAAEAAAKLGLTLPVALDDGQASSAYHVSTIPHTVVIDAQGRVAAVLRGPQGEADLERALKPLLQP